ncbi:PQQ-binding-like beta-propeller repeat protein [Spirillospora sp. NPDC077959]|uniref:outer membrane protein assembly factor BamB family protein n=1 Tax=Spirillospora sp. NPDC077959 TaxID=3364529 RepID=UPI0037D4E54F
MPPKLLKPPKLPKPLKLPKSTRSRALAAAGGFLAALLLVFGVIRACGDGGSDAGPLPLPDGEKQPKAVSFSDKAMWNEHRLGMSEVAGVELRGDVAIVAGEVGLGSARLAVVDVRTGAPRWTVDAGSPLSSGGGAVARQGSGYRAKYMRSVTGNPAVYGEGDDWTVLVQYTVGRQRDETEIGVAALSGEDGAVRWKHALVRPRSGAKGDGDRDQETRVLAADARVALVSVEAEEGVDPRTIALDAATGRKLWEHEGGWAYRFAGDLVLGETRGDRPPSETWGDERKGADVFALDVKTGKKRWDLSGAFDSSHLDAVAGGTAVVNVRKTDPTELYPDLQTIVLDAATGREIPAEGEGDEGGGAAPYERLFGCVDDGRTLIACPGSDGRLVTIRSGPGAQRFTAERPPFDERTTPHVDMVWQDRIFVHASPDGDRPARRAVVDRAGNRIGSAPPGEVAAVSEKAIAFRAPRQGSSSSSRVDGLVVHAAAAGAKPPGPRPGRPSLKPPRIDAAPLWTGHTTEAPAPASASKSAKDTGLRSVQSIRLAGDAIVYTGRDAGDRDLGKLVVADAGTGKVRWSVRKDASLGGGAEANITGVPHIVDTGEKRLALVEYSGPGDEEGVAALSLKDGSVQWKKRTTGSDSHAILRAADGKTFAVDVSRYGGSANSEEMIVHATGTGKELWRKRGVEPESVGAGLVLAAELGPVEDGRRERRDLIAYGASDGERRWRLGDRYREPELLHDEGGRTIVVGTEDGGAVLDRATGRELARTSTPLARCDGDGDTLIVCRGGPDRQGRDAGDRAVTIQTRGGATKINDLLETGFLTRYGAIGDWFVAVRPARTGARTEAERFLLLDGEGRLISDDLPGRPRAIGGGFAVLTSSKIVYALGGSGAATFSVHRVRE